MSSFAWSTRAVGSDFWPHPAGGQPYIVMEYVPGDTLEGFALKYNPGARQCLRLLLDVTRTLGDVHGAGVFHRDLKPTNILIRETSKRPVLIDFGIASLEGAAQVTQTRIPPATEEFRAPEPLRFLRENADNTARYDYTPTDELWALGVTLYWLLTDVYPFGERTDEGGVLELRERILTRRPMAPHLVNPRVPLAVSQVCMKMLAEWSGERYATVPELCAALQEALTQAENDATWDVPLMDPHDPQVATTLDDPELKEPDDFLRACRKAAKCGPRRGLVRPNEAPVPPLVPTREAPPRVPIPEAAQDISPTVSAPHGVGPAAKPKPPGEDGKPAPSVPVPPAREQLAPHVAPWLPCTPWHLALAAALATVALAGLSMSAGLGGVGRSSYTDKDAPEMPLSSTSPMPRSAGGSLAGYEVAPVPKPLESSLGEGAVPVGAQPPAPTANAMLRTPVQTKKNETQTQRTGLRLPVNPAIVTAAAIAACTSPGCTSSTAQVRHELPQVTCPEGWKETNERFELFSGGIAILRGHRGEVGEMARVKEGSATLKVGEGFGVGNLPQSTLLLGTWYFGENRLFGTFTQAQIPGAGTFPVCLVIRLDEETSFPDERGNEWFCPGGLGTCFAPGSSASRAMTLTRFRLRQPY